MELLNNILIVIFGEIFILFLSVVLSSWIGNIVEGIRYRKFEKEFLKRLYGG